LAIRHSLLAVLRDSPFAIRDSPSFPIRDSPFFTIRNSLFAIRGFSPLAARRSLLAARPIEGQLFLCSGLLW
jgi:hypothetical protein